MPTCPNCGSQRLRKSRHARGLEVYAQFFNLLPYHCDRCRWRGLRFAKSKDNPMSIWQIAFTGIAVFVAVAVLIKFLR